MQIFRNKSLPWQVHTCFFCMNAREKISFQGKKLGMFQYVYKYVKKLKLNCVCFLGAVQREEKEGRRGNGVGREV